MEFKRKWPVGVGMVGVGACVAAGAILWLVVTDPVAVAMFLAGGL